MRAARLVMAICVASPAGGCVSAGVLQAVVSPTCLTTPRVEAEFANKLEIDLKALKATSTTSGKLKRRCYSNPRTYEEGVAKVLGGVGDRIRNPNPAPKPAED